MANVNGRLGAAVVSLTLGMFFAASHPVAAQDLTVAPAIRAAMASDAALRPTLGQPAAAPRPAILMPLYVSFAALQVLDITSTRSALAGGGVEGNPIMGGVVGSPVAMTAVKLGAAAGIVFLSEKVRKRNPVAAVVMMVGMNSAYAMVVSRNYAIARQ
jgi:hypothetical protein